MKLVLRCRARRAIIERRGAHRFTANFRVAGRVPATPVEVTILNLSVRGCLLAHAQESIRVGTTIVLDLSQLDAVTGQVVRQSGDQLAIEFHESLSPEALGRLLPADVDHHSSASELKDRFGRLVPPLNRRFKP